MEKGEQIMAQTGYSKTVMEHFMNPRNVGAIENPDGYGKVGNPVCGDLMEIFLKIRGGKVDDIKFRTFGCGAAIAVSSMVTEMAKGRTLEEAMNITRKDVAEELGGLPPQKMHCSNLGADALHAAINDYWVKVGKIKPEDVRSDGRHDGEDIESCGA
jgi:nitrogen fixation NifU-like protein